MTPGAATTTIREALGDPDACSPDSFADEVRGALSALASLEQLVEAAREVVGHSDAAFVRLSAALAAVGPGLIVGKHPKTDDGDTVALHD